MLDYNQVQNAPGELLVQFSLHTRLGKNVYVTLQIILTHDSSQIHRTECDETNRYTPHQHETDLGCKPLAYFKAVAGQGSS